LKDKTEEVKLQSHFDFKLSILSNSDLYIFFVYKKMAFGWFYFNTTNTMWSRKNTKNYVVKRQFPMNDLHSWRPEKSCTKYHIIQCLQIITNLHYNIDIF